MAVARPETGRAPTMKRRSLGDQGRRRPRGRMRGKRFGKMRAKRRENLTEEQQNQAEQCDRNGGRNTQMGCLAETAIRLVMPARVGVRHYLQQKENGNQRQRKSHTRGQAAIPPDCCQPSHAACEQVWPFHEPWRQSAYRLLNSFLSTIRTDARTESGWCLVSIDASGTKKDGILKRIYWAKASGLAVRSAVKLAAICPQILRTSSSVGFLSSSYLASGL